MFGFSTPAAQPAGGAFGGFGGAATAAAPAANPFGAAAPATAPAGGAGGGLFGAARPAAPATGGFFGAPAPAAAQPFGALGGAAPAGGGMFGAASAAAGAPKTNTPLFGGLGGGFGAPAAPAATPAYNWGAPAGAAPAPAAAAQQALAAPTTTLLPQREIEAIEAALNDAAENSRFRFRALLHDMVLDPAARVKPAGVDELRWREALEEVGGERNAEGMWPVQAQGFEDLCTRYAAQGGMLAEQSAALERAARALAARQRRRDASVAERVERVRERHAEQTHRLLRAARLAEGLDAAHAPWAPEPLRAEEVALRARLAQLRAELAAGGGTLARRADALRAAARAKAAQPPQAQRPGAPGADTPAGAADVAASQLETDSLQRLQSLLAAQSEALRTLAAVVKRDARDVGIIEAQAAQDGDAMRS